MFRLGRIVLRDCKTVIAPGEEVERRRTKNRCWIRIRASDSSLLPRPRSPADSLSQCEPGRRLRWLPQEDSDPRKLLSGPSASRHSGVPTFPSMVGGKGRGNAARVLVSSNVEGSTTAEVTATRERIARVISGEIMSDEDTRSGRARSARDLEQNV